MLQLYVLSVSHRCSWFVIVVASIYASARFVAKRDPSIGPKGRSDQIAYRTGNEAIAGPVD